MVHYRMKLTASASPLPRNPSPRLGNFVVVLKRITEFTWGLPWLIDYPWTYIRLGLIVIETVVNLGTWLNTFSTDRNDYGEFVGTFNYIDTVLHDLAKELGVQFAGQKCHCSQVLWNFNSVLTAVYWCSLATDKFGNYCLRPTQQHTSLFRPILTFSSLGLYFSRDFVPWGFLTKILHSILRGLEL